MKKEYVVITIGYGKKTVYVLKERLSKGSFGAGLKRSRSLEVIKAYADENNMNIVAIGDCYQVA